MRSPCIIAALLVLASWGAPIRAAIVVENHTARAVIVVPAAEAAGDAQARMAAQSVADAAAELRTYIAKSTGATLPIVPENLLQEEPATAATLFVGPCQATSKSINTDGLQPEGFMIKVAGARVYIVGNDRTKEGLAVQGTAYGCFAFLEKFLGVRWLMPGELGEVVPTRATLVLDDAELREEPLLWQRKLRDTALPGQKDRVAKIVQEWGVSIPQWEKMFAANITSPWFRRQRLGSRVKVVYGHAYGGWWDRYHEKYPEIFALQPDGTRNTGGYREKLCVSNPTLWTLVAQEKIRELKANPFLSAASISPNDGGGSEHCSCAQCRAWDAKTVVKTVDDDPDAIRDTPQPSLTDRHFRFYNEVAKLVAKEVPDRFLGCYAYSIYRVPPVELDELEKNLIVGFVGFNSYLSDRVRTQDRQYWTEWSRRSQQLFVRPNLFCFGMGLPVNYVRKLASDLRFMAANGMRAADYDGLSGNWGTEGLNYYAAARLLWNPDADPAAIIDDYCAAAYGQGAPAMKQYYARLEKFTDQIAAEDKYQGDTTLNVRVNGSTLAGYYSDSLLDELRAMTDNARAAIGSSDPRASARVDLVRAGLDYVPHVRNLILAAAAVREGRSTEATFKTILANENAYFATMALSWSVSVGHNYHYIRGTLRLKPVTQ